MPEPALGAVIPVTVNAAVLVLVIVNVASAVLPTSTSPKAKLPLMRIGAETGAERVVGRATAQ